MINANAILEDIKLPDYKERHVFTGKLRLVIFLIFWVLGATYFRGVWASYAIIPLLISLSFLITGVCYNNILQNKYILTSFILEMLADLLSISLVVYMTGGGESSYFTLYMIYVSAAGMFYSPRIALLAAVFSVLSYAILVLGIHHQWIPRFVYPQQYSLWTAWLPQTHYLNLSLAIVFIPVIVYAVKISYYFISLKERALEVRNKQLLALNRISRTIKRATSLEDVIQNVLSGVIEGLGYQVCFLVLVDKREGNIRFHVPKGNPYIPLIEEKFGVSLQALELPNFDANSIFQAIKRNRIVFRQKLSELVVGIEPAVLESRADEIQNEMGFKKFVITPLVAERKIIGALVGVSIHEFIDQSSVGILESFTDQSALAIDSAILIEELKIKNVELERANKIKSEFLAVMSHELRTPLTAVIGFSELLLEGVLGEMNHDQKDSLKEVLKNGEHLLGLINSVLDLAKAEAGKMELNLEPLNLNDIAVDVKNSVIPLIDKKGLTLELIISEALPLMYADMRKMKQILLNLLSNAIKFTPEGGKIILSTYYSENKFMIQVKDTGIGIARGDLNKIFDVFHQVDSSYTRKYQGTGLGLALTKQFVELHGGTLLVDSDLGQGSQFTVEIPRQIPVDNAEQ